MASILGDLQDFIDWAYALYVDLDDRLNALEGDNPDDAASKYKPLKLKTNESIVSAGGSTLLFGPGWKLFGTGAAEFGRLLLKGLTTVKGTIDFTDATVIGLRLGGSGGTEILFSQAADIEGLTSPPWAPAATKTLTELRVLASTGPSSSLTVNVLVNGSSVGSVTLGTGATDGTAVLSTTVSTSDKVQVSSSAGSGAVGLTAIVRYK